MSIYIYGLDCIQRNDYWISSDGFNHRYERICTGPNSGMHLKASLVVGEPRILPRRCSGGQSVFEFTLSRYPESEDDLSNEQELHPKQSEDEGAI